MVWIAKMTGLKIPQFQLYLQHFVKIILALCLIERALSYQCAKDAKICETSLVIEHRLTMMTNKSIFYPSAGNIYRYDDTNARYPVSIDDVITADGWYDTPRLVVVANNTLPGPPIIVYEGQRLVINVTNNLQSEQVTIHWHGLPQKGSAFMDGVPFISQCPIKSGQHFIYNFTASPKGTYWYHSHMGTQRGKGLFGALIIREKNPHHEVPEHILTIMEWNHSWDSDIDQAREDFGAFDKLWKVETVPSLDGTGFPKQKIHSGLINGRGRYADNGAPLEIFQVRKGETYRFRLIATGTAYPWEISIDQHNLTVVSTDGYDIEPLTVDSVIIQPGERYDFILTAEQEVGNYWIRGQTVQVNSTSARAILRYNESSHGDPFSNKRICTPINRCKVLNCPFLLYPKTFSNFTDCLTYKDIKGIAGMMPPKIKNTTKFQEIFLNFGFPGERGSSINGRKFLLPTLSSSSHPHLQGFSCDDAGCGEQKICKCTYSMDLTSGNTVQIVFINMGSGSLAAHPIHLHGHTFWVVKVGFGKYDESSALYVSPNTDINCRGGTEKSKSYCNSPTWTNETWLNGNVPDLQLLNPAAKDTIVVPSGGYVVVRIIADNPGVWMWHCHSDVHGNSGMSIMINESFPEQQTTPNGLPLCPSSQYLEAKMSDTSEEPTVLRDDKTDQLWAAIIALIVIAGVESFALIICACVCCRTSTGKSEKYDMSAPQTRF